jgi:hypothetical protein
MTLHIVRHSGGYYFNYLDEDDLDGEIYAWEFIHAIVGGIPSERKPYESALVP